MPLTRLQEFIEYFQKNLGLFPTGVQVQVARYILEECPNFLGVGTGKTTLFNALESFAKGQERVITVPTPAEKESAFKAENVKLQKENAQLKADLAKATIKPPVTPPVTPHVPTSAPSTKPLPPPPPKPPDKPIVPPTPQKK